MNSDKRILFRLPVFFSLRFRHVSLPEGFEGDTLLKKQTLATWCNELTRLKYSAFTKDLSGGGLSMFTEESLIKGNEIFLEIETPDLQLRLAGRVVWSRETQLKGSLIHQVGVEFLGIEKKEQDQIIKFIFSEQRRRQIHNFG